MDSVHLYVPTIRSGISQLDANGDSGFDEMFEMWERMNRDNLSVQLDFTRCGFLHPNAIAFLGGLIRLTQTKGGEVTVVWNQRGRAFNHLQKTGFTEAFGLADGIASRTAIPFRQDQVQDKEGLVSYLSDKWLGRGWISVSRMLSGAVVGKVWEIYANAFEHAHSPVGVFSCGQYYPGLKQIELSVVDFGVGIPHNVRLYKDNWHISPERALKWAFQPGATTRPNGTSRGLGLGILKDFVQVNKGKLEVFSNDAYVIIDGDEEEYSVRNHPFEGTMVNITLICDEKHYYIETEKSDSVFE